MHVQFGDYHVRDVEFVAAFDVDAKKVGFDLSDAIGASENNTIKICRRAADRASPSSAATPSTASASTTARPSTSPTTEPVDVVAGAARTPGRRPGLLPARRLRGRRQVLRAVRHRRQVAFVNALPVFIAGTRSGPQKFEDAGVPIVGDDIKSQVGATITHRVLAKLFEDRGVVLDRTYQLNVGGNMDFKNMLERDRLESKKISKTQAVTCNMRARPAAPATCTSARRDYVQWLDDRKWAYVRLEGRAFGDVPLNLEYKLEVWDSPNSAGVIIDAIRAREDRQGPRHRRPDPLGVVVLHEVPARAVRRRHGPRRTSSSSSAATVER